VRPDYLELMRAQMQESLGERYVDTLDLEECQCQEE
jgi:hypothetical protein